MKFVMNLTAFVVALGLALLTVSGARSFSGSWLFAVLLSSLLPLQWACIREGMRLIRYPGTESFSRIKGTFWILAWFFFAAITVPMASTDMYATFSADATANNRFDQEQRKLELRARELDMTFTSLGLALAEFTNHARAMTKLEEKSGGSCSVNLRGGLDGIYRFRQGDERSAESLKRQASPELESIRSNLKEIAQLRYSAKSLAATRLEMNRFVNQLNSIQRSFVLQAVETFRESSIKRAQEILVKGNAFTCEDETREQLLTQLKSGVAKVTALLPLHPVVLLDPTDSKFIAQGNVLRTWSPILDAALPPSWRNHEGSVDPALFVIFNVTPGGNVLTRENFALWINWMLEIVMVALLFVGLEGGGSPRPRKLVAIGNTIVQLFLKKLEGQPGLMNEIVTAAFSSTRTSFRENHDSLFSNEQMKSRALTVSKYYRLYGSLDLLVIPGNDFLVLRAARELERQGYLKREAWSITTAELLRDRWFAAALQAVDTKLNESRLWSVYKITDPEFASWLLSLPIQNEISSGQPAEAR